ncbi:MAG: hydroxymethylglutaryl-CoA synthase, partial [Pseudomonadota bacterium]
QDFPVFNGKYSTTCYIDETLHALDELYTKRGLAPSDYLRSLKHVFMHRPYRRMPENGWAIAWLFALARGNADDRRQIEGYCETAGISFEDLAREMNAAVDVQDFATPDALNNDAYPLTMAVLHAFRGSDRFKPDVLDKLSLGGDAIRDLGNLYTAALPAWLAAGFEEALDSDLSLTGSELLTMGYGSGDAAEVIPFFVGERWRDAANRIHFADAMQGAVDLTCEQYEALHDGRRVSGLEWVPADEFVIERVGQSEERHFQDVGIEYYRYV